MKLDNVRVAILATDGFEEVELTSPREILEKEGAECHIVAPAGDDKNAIRSWQHTDWGESFDIDRKLSAADPAGYDMLLLPGGVLNPDQLRMNEGALRFVQAFFRDDKPVAAICHGAQTMIDAEVVEGRTMTSYPAIRRDLINAGADWQDREVVTDGNLVTSRSPRDLDAFNRTIVELAANAVPAD